MNREFGEVVAIFYQVGLFKDDFLISDTEFSVR